jgi:hypothetical protein
LTDLPLLIRQIFGAVVLPASPESVVPYQEV